MKTFFREKHDSVTSDELEFETESYETCQYSSSESEFDDDSETEIKTGTQKLATNGNRLRETCARWPLVSNQII